MCGGPTSVDRVLHFFVCLSQVVHLECITFWTILLRRCLQLVLLCLNKGPLVQLSYYFKVERRLLPKINTTILTLLVPVLWSTKAPGGIKVVINLISSDIILVDHLTLLLMESTGRYLEVIIS